MHYRWFAPAALWAVSTLLPGQVFDQFASFVPPPPGMVFDDVRGEIVNYETQLSTPIVVLRGNRRLVVLNEADHRVIAYDTGTHLPVEEVALGQGLCSLAERPMLQGQPNPAELWVTMRHQSAVAVISTAQSPWRVVRILRPPIAANASGAREADSPGGLAFNTDGTKVFVAQANTDTLTVYDAVNKVWLASIPLVSAHNGLQVAMNEPFAVARVGSLIAVASLASGNQTLSEANPASLLPPPRIEVKDLDQDLNRSLPDLDVLLVDPVTQSVVGERKGLGSMIFGLRPENATGRAVVTSFKSRNGEFVGERSFLHGKVVFNQLSMVDLAGSAPTLTITLENLVPGAFPPVNVVMPTDSVVDSTGRVFVAGYASANIGVFSTTTGAFLGALSSDAGPRGLAMVSVINRLYSYNRIANTITYYDLSAGLPSAPTGVIPLFDPTFDRVQEGRALFNRPNSEKLTTFCGSCHPDVRKDALAWDLSKYHDPGSGFTLANPPQFWQDRKGVMTTQDLRGLAEVPPYHWRGEQLDLIEFNGAFRDLLHGRRMSETNFALMQDFVFSCVYPPNPFQPMNRDFTVLGTAGVNTYTTNTVENCQSCHLLPTGTDCSLTDVLIGAPNSPRTMKTTQLRGLWTKEAAKADIDDTSGVQMASSLGAGLLHSGVHANLDDFLVFFFGGLGPALPGLSAMMHAYDSGLAPSTQYAEWVTQSNALSNRAAFLADQADHVYCDLAVRARWTIGGTPQALGMVYRRQTGTFDLDDSALETTLTLALGPLTLAVLLNEAVLGNAEYLFLGAPVWSGERLGVDRDRDRLFDRDELAAGTDPKDPDTDDDGFWDGEDSAPLGGPNAISLSPPGVVLGSIRVVYATTNSIKITWETDALSPTRIEWGITGFTQSTGDPFPLPVGGVNPSNHWKRLHTALVRVTSDESPHFIRIVTQGQNGMQGSALVAASPSTTQDVFNGAVRVQSVGMTHVTVGAATTYTATVVVVDGAGTPMGQAVVNGLFTAFVNGIPTQTVVTSAPTILPTGATSLSLTVNGQSSGDEVVFDVPMTVQIPGGTIVFGVVPLSGGFAWSESATTSVTDLWTP